MEKEVLFCFSQRESEMSDPLMDAMGLRIEKLSNWAFRFISTGGVTLTVMVGRYDEGECDEYFHVHADKPFILEFTQALSEAWRNEKRLVVEFGVCNNPDHWQDDDHEGHGPMYRDSFPLN